ncbi:MAG TPA: hypothetical protein VFH57_02315 [Gammaproteobacteria bacterium]|nr:hypothetical protein [Gammaproteobacteria bacterium]
MREIYTSPRHENINLVVQLFAEHGIQTHVSQMPGHRRNAYTRFSYRDNDSKSWPKVWVVRPDDLPQARALLREAGVEPTVRFAEDLARARAKRANPLQRRRRITTTVRMVLLGVIVILALLMAWRRFAG